MNKALFVAGTVTVPIIILFLFFVQMSDIATLTEAEIECIEH